MLLFLLNIKKPVPIGTGFFVWLGNFLNLAEDGQDVQEAGDDQAVEEPTRGTTK